MNTSLSGGAEDKTAPQFRHSNVDSAQLNFSDDRITVQFDEYIELNDPDNEIIISPMPSKKPSYKKLKKGIEIKFNETLQANTTYTIDFGKAVKDYTAGNPADYKVSFSTGNTIDTLSIEGSVKDAYTGLAVKDLLVGLYDNFKDTGSIKKKPLYVTRTDENGFYHFGYLPEKSFYIIAFEDKNKDYIPEESSLIGFNKDAVMASSEHKDYNLQVFKYELPLKLKLLRIYKIDSNFYQLVCNKIIDSNSYSANIFSIDKDTAYLYDQSKELTFSLGKDSYKIHTDTISFKKEFKRKLGLLKDEAVKNLAEYPYVTIESNYPFYPDAKLLLGQVDSRICIGVKEDTVYLPADTISVYGNGRYMAVKDKFKTGKKYSIGIETNCTVYADGGSLKTAFKSETFTARNYKDFGIIKIEVRDTGVKNESNYIIELFSKDKTYRLYVERPETQKIYNFNNVIPGNYQLRLIIDSDKNRNWTSGSILDKKQAERVYNFSKEISVKANWDTEAFLDID